MAHIPLPLVAPESSYNELTVLAAKEKTGELPFLAASGVLWHGGSLPETRVMGLPAGNQTGIGGCWPVTSTLVWGSPYRCDGTASGRLVGLDYADQRFYASSYGRFNTPDPYKSGSGSGTPSDPASWNKYAYVEGDPINEFDPTGEFMLAPQPDWGILWPIFMWAPQPQRPVRPDPPTDFPECNPGGNPEAEFHQRQFFGCAGRGEQF